MNLEMIRIREADKRDATVIADISRESFYDAVGPYNSTENMDKFMSETFSRDKLMSEVEERSHIFLLAYSENLPVGYVKLRDALPSVEVGTNRAIEIARIYVIRPALGRGVGKALMLRSLEIAKTKGNEVIWLGVWEHNLKAHAFYKKWGFERFGEHIFMLGNDPQTDWLMKKTLNDF